MGDSAFRFGSARSGIGSNPFDISTSGLIVSVLLAISPASCQARPDMITTPVPDDFNIVVTAGELMAGSAQRVLQIDANGKGRFSAYESDEPGAARSDSAFTLDEAQLESLWNTIQEQDFFSLDPQYAGKDVDDGAFAILTITAQGRTHRVVVENRSVPRFERIVNAINQMTPSGMDLSYPGNSGPD